MARLSGFKPSAIEYTPWRNHSIEILELSVDSGNALDRSGITALGQLSDLLTADHLSNLEGVDVRLAFEIRESMYAHLAAIFLSMAQSLPTTLTSEPLSSFGLSHRLLTLAQNEGCSTLEQLTELICNVGPAYVRLWMGWQTFVELVDGLAVHYESTFGLNAKIANRPPIHVDHNSSALLDFSSVSQAANGTSSNFEPDKALRTDESANENPHWRERPIDVLGLSVRSYNALQRVGITTLGLLAVSLGTEQFLSIRNVGVKTQSEISERLQAYLATLPDRDTKPTVPKAESSDQHLPNLLTGNDPLDDTTTDLCPAWHSYSTDRLDLPARIRHILACEGCTTLGQLALLTEKPGPPTHIDGIGWKSFADLKEHLSVFLAGLPQSAFGLRESGGQELGVNSVVMEEANSVPLQDRIVGWLSSLPERDYQTIAWRYGFDGESLTLDAVGEKLGLTRERVRQIENKAIRQLRRPKYDDLTNSIMAIVGPAFEQSGTIMTDDEITKVAGQFAPAGISGLGLMRLLGETSNDFTRYNRAGVWVWGDQSELLLDTQSMIMEVLKAAKAPIGQDTLQDRFQVSDFYRLHRAELTDTFLRACLRTHPNVEHRGDGLLGLTVWAKHRIDDIIMAMRQISHPAHYTEITELVNKLLPEDMQAEPHNIHAQMQRYPDIFVRVGQGTYGLAEWGLEPAEFYPDIIERIFRECGHPLSLQQILTRVCEERDCKETTVTMILQFNDRFRAFPGGVYGLTEWRDDEFPDRSYREKRLIAAIVESEVRNKRKPKREIVHALQDIDDLIGSARTNNLYENHFDLLSAEAE